MAASPKSEMCSCCCCCSVVTVVGAGVLTARAVGRAPPAPPPPEPPPKEEGAPYRTEAASLERPIPQPTTQSWVGQRFLGFFLLPLALALGIGVATLDPYLGMAVGIAAYVGGLTYLVTKASSPPWLFLLILLVPLVAGLEAYLYIVTIFK
jgi:hypothetical protein